MNETGVSLLMVAFANLAAHRQCEHAAFAEQLRIQRHDLRSAMTGVVGSANLIAVSDTLDEAETWADQLLASSERVLELVDQIHVDRCDTAPNGYSTIGTEVGAVRAALAHINGFSVSVIASDADTAAVDASYGRAVLAAMCELLARYLEAEPPVSVTLQPVPAPAGHDVIVEVATPTGIRPETELSRLLGGAPCGAALHVEGAKYRIRMLPQLHL